MNAQELKYLKALPGSSASPPGEGYKERCQMVADWVKGRMK